VIRHIPPFILAQLEKGDMQGSFCGYVMLLDIVDFTGISEVFQKQYDHGADRIGELLNAISEGSIRSIESHGGFVSLFIGDAICAVFPGEDPRPLLCALGEIRRFLSGMRKSMSGNLNMKLELREIISYGDIAWEILEISQQYEYFFYGEAFRSLTLLAEDHCQNAYSQTFVQQVGAEHFSVEDGCQTLQIPPLKLKPQKTGYTFKKESKDLFEHPRLRGYSPTNEIRNLAVCFVGLRRVQDYRATLLTLARLAERHLGYVNKVDYTGSYPVVVVIFGIPLSTGKSIRQACEFSLSLSHQEDGVSIGLSCGYAYAGYVGSDNVREYTALGHCMNIASRLMNQAALGDVICDTSIAREIDGGYLLERLGETCLRGLKKELNFFRLKREPLEKQLHFKHHFVGRENELEYLDYVVKTNLTVSRNTVIYIHGEPGIGKSRLAWRFIQSLKNFHSFTAICPLYDGRVHDPVKQILKHFFGFSYESTPELLKAKLDRVFSERGWNEAYDSRFKADLASILDLEYPGSASKLTDPDEKNLRQIKAFSNFISLLAKEMPVLIMIDDGQWLAESSRDFFDYLDPKERNPIFIITTCRYLSDGSKMDLGLSKLERYDMELGALKEEDQMELLRQILSPLGKINLNFTTISDKAGGYPLYLEQMAYYILEHTGNSIEDPVLPEVFQSFSISDVINSRIDHFGQKMRETVYAAAVIGMIFDTNLLEQVVNHDISSALEIGERHRLWNKIAKHSYSFSHAVIHQNIYERMLKSDVMHLHRQIADSLAKDIDLDVSGKAEAASYHYSKAGMLFETQKYMHLAAKHYMDTDNWHEGIRRQRETVIYSGRIFGFGSAEHIENLFWLAIGFHYMQLYDKAEKLYEIVYANRVKALGHNNLKISPYVNNLGRFYKDVGRFDEAEKLLRKSLDMEITIGKQTDIADRLNNLASLYNKQGKWKLALSYSQKALVLFEQSTHIIHDYYVGMMELNIGYLHFKMGKPELAEEKANRALKLMIRDRGGKNPRVALCYLLLAECYSVQKKYEKAEKKMLYARRKYGQYFGKESPDYANTNLKLGDLYEQMGQEARAASYWKKGAKVLKAMFPPDNPFVQEADQRLKKIALCPKR